MQPAGPEGSCIRSPNFETGRVILGLTVLILPHSVYACSTPGRYDRFYLL
jgi:hypothetical protein